MAIVDHYCHYIQKLLTKYASYQPSSEDIEAQLIFDTERDATIIRFQI